MKRYILVSLSSPLQGKHIWLLQFISSIGLLKCIPYPTMFMISNYNYYGKTTHVDVSARTSLTANPKDIYLTKHLINHRQHFSATRKTGMLGCRKEARPENRLVWRHVTLFVWPEYISPRASFTRPNTYWMKHFVSFVVLASSSVLVEAWTPAGVLTVSVTRRANH